MESHNQYDYIITGAGCAGLSLLMHMIDCGGFSDRNILLVDKEEKNKNDRTWCFWETEAGLFNPVVFKEWTNLWYYDKGYSRLLDIRPYAYKMIRGIDFYNYCFDKIRAQRNIDLHFGQVENLETENEKAVLTIGGRRISADYIFNSISFQKPGLKKGEYYLLQHFKGWIIETEEPVFNVDEATMMDFRLEQRGGTTFVYIMPFSETKALIEYTLFTESILQPREYDEALRKYIMDQLKIDKYRITDEEFGIIPMTNHSFSSKDRVINIGSAGGQTKASTGYTFKFIQKNSEAIVNQLLKAGKPFLKRRNRFNFYDSTLLNILYNKKLSGPEVFTPIFTKNKPQHILRFLDNESSIAEELRIISSLPTMPFLRAAMQQL